MRLMDNTANAWLSPNNIINWFDVKNPEHLRAYKHLMDEGVWPTGFIPKDNVFTVNWEIVILGKLADAYLDSKGI